MRPARLQGVPQPRPRHASLNEALERAAVSGRRGLTFVAADETETSLGWDAVRSRAAQVAGALASLGVLPGERVALVLPTGADFMDAFFGTLLAGAVPVPLYPPVRLGRLAEYHAATARMLQLSSAVALLSDARVGRLLGEAVRRAGPRLGLRTVAALRDSGATPLAHPADAGALALVQFSSGSTVDPKPVALSHQAVLAQTDALRALMPDDTPEDPQLGVSWLPLYHDMGLIGCLLSAMTYPGPLVLLGPEAFLGRPALWLRALSRHRGTMSVAPSFAFAVCARRVKDEEMEGADLSRWRLALNGAEQVSVDAARRFSERFARWGFRSEALMPVYGLAEAALALTFSPPRSPLRTVPVDSLELAREGRVRPGPRALASVGIPVPGVTVEVRDEAGAVVPEGVVGRIHARGPSIMEGYLGQPEATRAALDGGWLDTGDLGFVKDGELVVCGRVKDVVVLRGANHAPQEFEDALEGVKGVRTGCAVALGFVPLGGDGEELLLLVETTPDAGPDLVDRIRAAVAERTGVRPHAVQLLVPGTLPRTSSGKLRRSEALRRWTTGTLHPPARVNAIRLVGAMLRSALALARARPRPHPEPET
ncbi:MAG TPA: fatty acyl-AMP ligase [Myxococcaceae bacterium]|nr:fatty acyl-AMP ligase [Myxococcaceae bacterium]